MHITDLLSRETTLDKYQALALIGGFSNGDHLGAGTVQASRFKHRLKDDLERFIGAGKPIIGICNGFQTLVKMGVLPWECEENPQRWTQVATIMSNDSGRFEDRWVYLLVDPDSPCIWTRDIKKLFLPVRHGEGKFFTDDPHLIPRLIENRLIVVRYADSEYRGPTLDYPLNPNGSLEAIAGICDQTGLIFGLMPHPEAYLSPYNHPSWTKWTAIGEPLPTEGDGVQIFRKAVTYMQDS